MRSKIRIACSIPDPADGTSFYRAMGPLQAMVKEAARYGERMNVPQLEIVLPPKSAAGWELSWDWVAGCDIVFMQRSWNEAHVGFAELAKSLDLPVWIDWDDDLAAVRRSNPRFRQHYEDSDRVKFNRQRMVELADVVTAPTKELARRVAPTKARVVENACMFKFHNTPRARRVSWRGGDSHQEDVDRFLPEVFELARLPQFGRWQWMFMGDVPWQVQKAVPDTRLEIENGAGLTMFVPLWALKGPWVHIVPLANNPFNLCKSNNAWIEATCVGAVTVAPDWEEWRRPGVVNYKDTKDFGVKLREVMNRFDERFQFSEGVTAAREHIREHLMLSKVNEKRWKILGELL